MAVTIKNESNEIRIKMNFKDSKEKIVALRDSIDKKLPNRPDNSAQCWIDWEGDGCWLGYVDIYIFFPINEYAKYLEDIKSDIGEGRQKIYMEEIELKLNEK